MRKQVRFLAMTSFALLAAACSSTTSPDRSTEGTESDVRQQDANQNGETLRVAVLTGGHAFDVPHFYQLFRLPEGRVGVM